MDSCSEQEGDAGTMVMGAVTVGRMKAMVWHVMATAGGMRSDDGNDERHRVAGNGVDNEGAVGILTR